VKREFRASGPILQACKFQFDPGNGFVFSKKPKLPDATLYATMV